MKSMSGEPEPTAASGTGMERRQWNRSRPLPVAEGGRRRFWSLAGDWQAEGRRQSRQNQREMKRHGGSGLSVAIAEPYRRWQSPENQRGMQGGGGSGFWQAIGKPSGRRQSRQNQRKGAAPLQKNPTQNHTQFRSESANMQRRAGGGRHGTHSEKGPGRARPPGGKERANRCRQNRCTPRTAR